MPQALKFSTPYLSFVKKPFCLFFWENAIKSFLTKIAKLTYARKATLKKIKYACKKKSRMNGACHSFKAALNTDY
jgi:hypothetical protein